ncbi:MAG: hypothetical protein ACI955_002002 [Zhongshania sp.]|jgi:hypothetical protein
MLLNTSLTGLPQVLSAIQRLTTTVTQEPFVIAVHAACPGLVISGRSKTPNTLKVIDFYTASY